MRQEDWTPPPVGYCLQRRADDPHLRDTDLLAEITSLGYHGRLASMAGYLRHHGPARQPCTQCGSPADRAAAAHREKCLLAPDEPLPVAVRPLAGEMLASYLHRVAAANRLPAATLTAALPAWLTWKYAGHRLLPRGTTPTPMAAESLRRLAVLTGTHPAAIARALPVFGGGPTGPARAIAACRRCAAARGINWPVPVHHPAHEMVCTRHRIWLSPPGQPQLDITECPEITTAQHRARRLLRRCTPEQLIYAQVQAAALAASEHPAAWTPPGWEQRAQLLRQANPGLALSAEPELTRAATYPGIVAGTAMILTAAATAPCLIQFDASQLDGLPLRQIR
jgi:hypothetical protein